MANTAAWLLPILAALGLVLLWKSVMLVRHASVVIIERFGHRHPPRGPLALPRDPPRAARARGPLAAHRPHRPARARHRPGPPVHYLPRHRAVPGGRAGVLPDLRPAAGRVQGAERARRRGAADAGHAAQHHRAPDAGREPELARRGEPAAAVGHLARRGALGRDGDARGDLQHHPAQRHPAGHGAADPRRAHAPVDGAAGRRREGGADHREPRHGGRAHPGRRGPAHLGPARGQGRGRRQAAGGARADAGHRDRARGAGRDQRQRRRVPHGHGVPRGAGRAGGLARRPRPRGQGGAAAGQDGAGDRAADVAERAAGWLGRLGGRGVPRRAGLARRPRPRGQGAAAAGQEAGLSMRADAELALFIVHEDFGEVVHRVAFTMVEWGGFTLRECFRALGPAAAPDERLSKRLVRHAICVLLQHGLAHVECHARTGHRVYHFDAAAAERRLRFARMLVRAREEAGEDGEALVLQLVVHGRMRRAECIALALRAVCEAQRRADFQARVDAAEEAGDDPPFEDEPDAEAAALAALQEARRPALVRAWERLEGRYPDQPGFVELVGVPDYTQLSEAAQAEEHAQQAKRRKTGQAQGGGSMRDEAVVEEIRKQEAAYMAQAPPEARDPLFRLATATFMKYECVDEVGEYLSQRFGEDAGRLARKALLANLAAWRLEPEAADERGEGEGGEGGEGEEKQQDSRKAPPFRVSPGERAAAETLHRATMATMQTQGQGVLVLHVGAALDDIHARMVYAFVSDAFSIEAARVLRALTTTGQRVDDKVISDRALLPLKDTREKLYQLLAVGLVRQQEVPKRSDYNPSNTVYLWYAEPREVLSFLRDRVRRAILRLWRRRAHEWQLNESHFDSAERVRHQEQVNTALDRFDAVVSDLEGQLTTLQGYV